MKVIRTDMHGRDLPEKEIARGLTREAAENECDRLNSPLTQSSAYWHIVAEEDYTPITHKKIYGL